MEDLGICEPGREGNDTGETEEMWLGKDTESVFAESQGTAERRERLPHTGREVCLVS